MSPLVLLLFGAAPPIVPPDVTQWMRDLGHPNLAVRRTAVASLRERGEGVMPLLRKLAASDADVDVRVRASAINGMIRAELFEKPRVFDGNGGGDSDLAVSPDGRLALSAGDAVLKLWDVERGTLRASLKGHHCGIVGIAFAPDGKAAASGDIDGVIRLWDLGKGAEIRRWGGPGAIWCLTFAADGKAVYAGSDAGLVEAYTLDGKRTWRRMLSVPPQGVRAVARVPGTARALFGCMDGKCYVLDLATGKRIRTVERHTGSVMTVAVSSDGKTAASAGMDGWVRLWAVSDGSHTGRFYPAEWVKSLAFTPDGRRLLSCGHRGVIEVWDVASGKRVLDYRTPGDRPSEAWSLKLTRGGVLAAYADGKLREWRLPE